MKESQGTRRYFRRSRTRSGDRLARVGEVFEVEEQSLYPRGLGARTKKESKGRLTSFTLEALGRQVSIVYFPFISRIADLRRMRRESETRRT